MGGEVILPPPGSLAASDAVPTAVPIATPVVRMHSGAGSIPMSNFPSNFVAAPTVTSPASRSIASAPLCGVSPTRYATFPLGASVPFMYDRSSTDFNHVHPPTVPASTTTIPGDITQFLSEAQGNFRPNLNPTELQNPAQNNISRATTGAATRSAEPLHHLQALPGICDKQQREKPTRPCS